jgi:dipeptidyl aminopeptidase/acylaminoacyl peptidase
MMPTLRAPLGRASAILLLLAPAAAAPLAAQEQNTVAATATATTAANVPGALPLADYARWRSIQGSVLSANGQWVAWTYTQLRRDDELHVRHLDSGRAHTVARGARPAFSDDGRWVAYSVSPPFAEVEKLEKDKKPVLRRAELMNLETGEKVGWDNVASFEFARGSSHLLVKKNRPEPRPKHDGVDVVLRDLRAGSDELIGSVAWHGFNRPGSMLAWTVDAADMDGNGLYLLDLRSGARRTLDNSKAKYTQPAWSERGSALAALRGVDVDSLMQRDNSLVAFASLGGRTPVRTEINAAAYGLPSGHVISERTSLTWTAAEDRVLFGIKAQEPKTKPAESWQKPSDVDVFHWKDDRLQSVQAKRAEADRNRTDRAALSLATKSVVPLTDGSITGIFFSRDGRWGVATDDRSYVSDWQEGRADYYSVNVATGERVPFLEAHIRTLGLAPDGRHFLYWKDDHVWAYQLETGRHTNITQRAPVSFANAEWDYLSSRPAYGFTGWAKDGRGVILDHRYDLWYVALDGSGARNLTNGVGSEHEIRLRYVRLDPEEQYVDLAQPLLLSAFGQWTKQAGFYQLSGGRMRKLLLTDNLYGTPRKARDADRLLLSRQSWNEYPDLQVARTDLSELSRITAANAQQSEYAWGRRILFDYTNRDGVRLQGTLAIPDSWQPGQRLPMLVSFYEKYSQNLHVHPVPGYGSGPQFAGYVSNGYLVMQPDVHFRGGSSHSDMLECVEAAVAKVVEMGYADPARVGLHGHSYSGGGASFIATRSKAFAAIVAGAAPINLVGEFNILFRGTGQNNHQYDIHGQGRYGSNPYDDFDMYWRESPIAHVRTMDTPLLYMHGDNDQIVEYNQGMEFYNALRFNGKPVIFLSYPGEGHGLTKLENQLDYMQRMEQFYGHYLKGEAKAAWMESGERFIDKTRRTPVPVNTTPPQAPATAANGGG